MDPKQTAILEVKLLSRDKVMHISYTIHMHFGNHWDGKHRLRNANDIPGNS